MAVLADRIGLGRLAGLQSTHDGKRDVWTALGYPTKITPAMSKDRYERDEMAATIVEAMPKSTWRGRGELVEDENPDTVTPFEEAWFTLSDRVGVWSVLQRADILAGLGRFAVVLIGGPGTTLSEELPKMRGPEDIRFLWPFGEDRVSVADEDLVDDPQDPRFMFPNVYTIKGLTARRGTTMDRKAHWTRVQHIADGLLDNALYSAPRLARVWNRLLDLEKVVGGGSEAFWLRVNQGMQLDMDKDVYAALQENPELLASTKADLENQIDEYQHHMRRVLRTAGMNLEMLGADVANFANQVDAIVSLLAAGSRIPKRILMGSEMGELASSQDRDNWTERVSDRREAFAAPHVVRPLIDRLIDHGALPAPKEYQVRWPEIESMDEEQRATIAWKYAQTNQAAGETVVTPDEIRDRILGLPPLAEVVDEAESEELLAVAASAHGDKPQAARLHLRAAKLRLRADRIRAMTWRAPAARSKKKPLAPPLSIAPRTGTPGRRSAW